MMDYPLTLAPILERAAKLFPQVEIVSRLPDKSLHRYVYSDFYSRTRALSLALQNAGLEPGDRVATLMWNHYIHFEAYFAVPVMGGVLHTLNLRLHPSELAYIVNHAQDRFLIVDDVLLPFYEKIRPEVNFERVLVVPLTGKKVPAPYKSYESFIEHANGTLTYPKLAEDQAAAMCYTSGTTGKPKGVVYSHRALVLHSLAIALPDSFNIQQRDVVLPAMSMFHANAWGLPFATALMGSKQVFPGPYVQPESLLELLEKERVTLTGAVPTVWLGVLEALEKHPGRWRLTPGMRIVSAGTAVPETMIRRFDQLGVKVIQPWGMTETTPIATVSTLQRHMEDWHEHRKYEIRARQGVPLPLIEVRAWGDAGEVPWDGNTMGELQVRGPWVAASYFKLSEERHQWTEDGWLCTGDIVNIDTNGYIKIVDRKKDVIKSGGEWISSVDMENALVAHPAVREAAVIAVPHPKWQERPLAVVVLKDNAKVSPEELRSFLATKFAKWQLPDDFVFARELPHTATGKLLKTELRKKFGDWEWNQPAASL
jgi:fatty-acyl-CoA synthase